MCDFGVARPLTAEPFPAIYEGAVPGKPRYMAPEIVGRVPFDGIKADMYSLGVVFSNIVLGAILYSDLSDRRFAYLREHGVRQMMREMNLLGRADESAVGLLERMLSMDPAARPTCDQVLASAWFGANRA
jgi:BR serine/threonine kinase